MRAWLTDAPGRRYLAAALTPEPANTQGWLWFTGLVLIVVLEILLGGILIGVVWAFAPESWTAPKGEGPRGGFADYLALFVMFVPAFALPILMWRYLHRLPVGRLLSVLGRVRWGHMGRAITVVFVVYVLWTGVDYLVFSEDYADHALHPDWGGFAVLLLITLLLCPIQAASEELLVRGYLNQGLMRLFRGARFAPPVIFVLTSVLFAALHIGNPEGEGQFWLYMAGTTVFGLAMCALVWFEGGLESAIGYHIANNIFVFSFVGYADPDLPQSAVWEAPDIEVTLSGVAIEVLASAAIVALILWWNRRAERGG